MRKRPSVDDIKAASQTKKDAQYQKRIKNLEKQLALTQDRLSRLKSSRWRIPTSKKTKKSAGGFVRVIIPDTHGCIVDKPSIRAVLGDLESLRPREIVWLGDHLDCGGFLAQHHTTNYVAQTEYSFEEDVNATNHLIDAVQAVCPKAVHHMLQGNHERRLETWALTQAQRDQRDANFLIDLVGARSQLHIEKRGINYYDQGQFYMGLPIPATIKLGHCYFTHGHSSARHTADVMLKAFGHNVVFGHVHRMQAATTKTVKEGVIGAWCPGCICELQPLWRHTSPTEWNHGYAIQLVQSDGSFLHINVPLIAGKSYLIQLTQEIT